MDSRPKVTPRSYEDFQPSFEWDQEEGKVTLRVGLPGFNKEQIKVQMDKFGNLRVSGERPLAGNHWSRFRKDFRIPENCSITDKNAKFKNGILYVTMSKRITTPSPQDQPTKVDEEPVASQRATYEPKPRENQVSTSQKDSPITSSKPGGSVQKQANGKSSESGEPADANKNVQTMQEKAKDRTKEPEDETKAKNDIAERHGELPDSRERESVTKDVIAGDGGSGLEKHKFKKGRLRFEKPRKLMLTVGVAIVILVALALYVTYKLRKSIEAD